jgi:formylglycine-generating enzyme required for sulfatase activity
VTTAREDDPGFEVEPSSGDESGPVEAASASLFASTRTSEGAPTTEGAASEGAPARPRPAPPIGRVLAGLRARFELGAELGRGAFGVVWRARERATRREVALKVLQVDEVLAPRRLERFRREGEVAASLDHPGLVKVHAAGDVEGVPWLAYALVDGARPLDRLRLELDHVGRARLVRDAARALGHAHARGVVHRDVKPDNLLVDAEGRLRVTDFGLAAAAGQDRLTRSGAMIGTPSFMSPEQAQGRRDEVGPPSDVWSLGVVLYHALAGALPFKGANVLELTAAIQRAAPRPLRVVDPTIPAELEAICAKALSPVPADRYPDGEALAADLDAFLEGRPVSAASGLSALRPRARRAGRLALLLGVPGAAVVLGLALALHGVGGATAARARGLAVRLEAPADRVVVWTPTVRVRGVVLGGVAPARVVVTTRGPGGAPTTRALHPGDDGAFDLALSLAPGETRVVVEAEDEGGARATETRVVRRGEGPPWYTLLPEAERAPYPLPDGVDWGRAPREYTNVRDGSTLVWVPPGHFRMGVDQHSGLQENAFPAHDVFLTRGYFIGKFEVTWAQYRRYAEATRTWCPTSVFEVTDDHPVHTVSWKDAAAYCAWAGLRLPTEAEWEYAARGGDGRPYPWGDDPPGSRRANFLRGDVFDYTSPVGSFPQGASPFGCLDMVGNVWEWVEDRYGPYDPSVQTDPTGPTGPSDAAGADDPKDLRTNRGGAWNSQPTYTATSRSDSEATYRGTSIGFRVAR